MPDGQSVLFTSDRGGSPQIYRLNLGSGAVERLTFDGTYNVSPRPFPDGKGFAFVRRDGGRFQIASQDFATRQVQVLTGGPGRRIAEHRAQRQADPLRERGRRPWYIGRSLERRPHQAASRRAGHRCA